jgi:hypothetical protein
MIEIDQQDEILFMGTFSGYDNSVAEATFAKLIEDNFASLR